MNLPRLAKMWALTASPNEGEAAAAREQARRMVERAGKTLADMSPLLGQAVSQPRPAPFAFAGISTPEGRTTWAAHEVQRKADHGDDPGQILTYRSPGKAPT